MLDAMNATPSPGLSPPRRCRPLAVWLLLGLAACGGGGGGSSSEDAAASPGGAGSPSTPLATSAEISCGIADFQAEALRLVNARRAAGATCGARGSFAAAPALAWDAQLAQAAYRHSRDMADHDHFSHTGTDGSTLGARVSAAGYAWSGVGENIGAGYGSLQSVVDGWMASDGHCANLMSPGFTAFGLACARNSASSYGLYWTLDLARPQ